VSDAAWCVHLVVHVSFLRALSCVVSSPPLLHGCVRVHQVGDGIISTREVLRQREEAALSSLDTGYMRGIGGAATYY
jgi:hypothetical protein